MVSEEVKRPRGQSTVTGDQLTWNMGVIAAHLQPSSGLLADTKYAQYPMAGSPFYSYKPKILYLSEDIIWHVVFRF